jgi:hypothetical protein
MSDILQEFYGEHRPKSERGTSPYFENFGLEDNPFPPNRKIIAEVLHGQETAFDKFKALARDVLTAGPPRRRAMGVVAGTGGGKTHFLRHCQYKFGRLCKALGRNFAIVEYTAGTLSLLELVRDIYRQCDAACRASAEADFLSALVKALASKGLMAEQLLQELALEDLRNALSGLLRTSQTSVGEGEANTQAYEAHRELFRRWLQGDTLTETERRRLGVMYRIGSAAVAVRIVGQILSLARRLSVVEGVLLCLDEMEAIPAKGTRLARAQAFLQDLRYFYDDAVKDEQGYSLLLISASTTTGAGSLLELNYPVYQRLGFEESERVELQRIRGVVEAIRFAREYIQYFNERWQQSRGAEVHHPRDPHSLLSDSAIEDSFREAAAGGTDAPQGPLLDVLNRKVETQRRAGESK